MCDYLVLERVVFGGSSPSKSTLYVDNRVVPSLEPSPTRVHLDSSSSLIPPSLSTSSSGLTKKVQNNAVGEAKMLTHLPHRPAVNIEFDNLSYYVPEGWRKKGYKTLLKGVHGKIRSGEITAIMGPSGAGKTTLMNILAGYKISNVNGDIAINGKARNMRQFRKMSCYIMQDDYLLNPLTVHEAMTVAANLKLGANTPNKIRQLVVNEILETLGLTEASNTRTANLSGGQRKRLAIAQELVNNPPVMFFDEPTSGLDSSSCFQFMTLLNQLAKGGRTIICTIHQPSSRLLDRIDRLYVLAEGQCIYQGLTLGLVPFLSSMNLQCPSYYNPADFVMEVASGEYGEHLTKLVVAVKNGKTNNWNPDQKQSQDQQRIVPNDIAKDGDLSTGRVTVTTGQLTPSEIHTSLLRGGSSDESLPHSSHTFPTSGLTQFRILLIRTFRVILRDTNLTQLRLVAHLAVGLIIGTLYWDMGNDAAKVYNNGACLFFSLLFLTFSAMMPTVLTFPLEIMVFVREHLNYWYSAKTYYLAKTLADTPFQIMFPTLYCLIVYFMSNQPLDPLRFFMFLCMCIMVSLVAQSLGLVMGAALDIQTAVFLGPIMIIPILLFSGFFVNFGNIPTYLRPLSYIAFVRYGFEGTLVAIYGMDRKPLDCHQPYCHFRNPEKVMQEMDAEGAIYWVDLLVLFGFFIFLRAIGIGVLKWKIYSLR